MGSQGLGEGVRVSWGWSLFGKMESSGDEGGDGGTMCMYSVPLNCALEMGKMESFVSRVFYDSKKHPEGPAEWRVG